VRVHGIHGTSLTAGDAIAVEGIHGGIRGHVCFTDPRWESTAVNYGQSEILRDLAIIDRWEPVVPIAIVHADLTGYTGYYCRFGGIDGHPTIVLPVDWIPPERLRVEQVDVTVTVPRDRWKALATATPRQRSGDALGLAKRRGYHIVFHPDGGYRPWPEQTVRIPA
jgi:hypothetical protein